MSSRRASRATCAAGTGSMSAGLAQIDSTGEEIASGSLLRSVIMPRVASSRSTRL